ncbi:MAG: YHS domain-containing protein [Chloroflexota bacterium]|nr:YHS domain-containing protein [Chloroflexota bacterium]
MQLTVLDSGPTSVRAGYVCPCGCTPSVEYQRGEDLVEEGCCCGNHFAFGPRASGSLVPKAGFQSELQAFTAPWGERLEAAWLVGPSKHADHASTSTKQTNAIDPVCGMTVDPDSARANGLHSAHDGTDYFFCGRGCKVDFEEDPDRYLDPG